jgi:hypothetical protein
MKYLKKFRLFENVSSDPKSFVEELKKLALSKPDDKLSKIYKNPMNSEVYGKTGEEIKFFVDSKTGERISLGPTYMMIELYKKIEELIKLEDIEVDFIYKLVPGRFGLQTVEKKPLEGNTLFIKIKINTGYETFNIYIYDEDGHVGSRPFTNVKTIRLGFGFELDDIVDEILCDVRTESEKEPKLVEWNEKLLNQLFEELNELHIS